MSLAFGVFGAPAIVERPPERSPNDSLGDSGCIKCKIKRICVKLANYVYINWYNIIYDIISFYYTGDLSKMIQEDLGTCPGAHNTCASSDCWVCLEDAGSNMCV